MSNVIVVKLGGSLVVPNKDEINFSYVKSFKNLIKEFPENKFIITIGGGYTCRWYQEGLKNSGFEDEMVQHKIGTASCCFNAELVRLVFGDMAAEKIFDGNGELDISRQVLITGAWNPGASSNYNAVEVAIKTGAKTIINLSDIDYIYDKDPKKFEGAIKIEEMTWVEYRSLFNLDRHLPGQHIPIDVIAANLSAKHDIKFYYSDGRNLENIKNAFLGKDFKGTIIG